MSTASALLDRLVSLGFEVGLGEHRTLIVRPASALVDELRQAIRSHRDGLMAALADSDPRVTCTRCAHHRPLAYRCANHRSAGLATPDVGSDLAALRQHCPGFAAP